MSLVESGSPERVRPRGDTLYNVQALRGIAAMIVVCLHMAPLFPPLGLISPGGGVELFFVISGFIMVYTTIGRPNDPRKFLANRLARIVPIYWFFTFFILLCAIAAPTLFKNTRPVAEDIFKSLFFIPFQKGPSPRPLLYVGWTLNYEMAFYLLFATGLLFRQYRTTLIFIMAALACLGIAGLLAPPAGVVAAFYINPFMLLFCFGMGVALLIRAWPPSLARARPALATVLTVAMIALCWLQAILPFAYVALCAGVCASIALYCAIAIERLGWRVRNRLLLRLGDASYSIYLSHAFLAAALLKLVNRLPLTPLVAIGGILAALIVSGTVGWFVHIWIERPLTNLARRLLSARGHAVPATA